MFAVIRTCNMGWTMKSLISTTILLFTTLYIIVSYEILGLILMNARSDCLVGQWQYQVPSRHSSFFHKSGGSTLDPSMSWQCLSMGVPRRGWRRSGFWYSQGRIEGLECTFWWNFRNYRTFCVPFAKDVGLVSLPSVGDRTIRYPVCHTPKERQHLFFWQNCEPPRWIASWIPPSVHYFSCQ